MKKIFTLILFCLVIQFNFAQELILNEYDHQISRSTYHLKGKIKQITTTASDKNGQSITLPFLENELYNEIKLEFNTKGNLTKRTNLLDYRGKLGIFNYIDYSYNNNQQLIEQKTTVINNGEDPLRVASLKQFQYDSKGQLAQLTEVVKTKNSTLSYQTDFEYTNRLDQIKTKVDGSVLSVKKLTYNSKGLLNREENTSFDGKKGLNKYYIYDQETPVYIEEEVDQRKLIQFVDLAKGSTKYQQFDQNQNLKLELVFNNSKNVTEAKVLTYQNGKPTLKTYQLNYEFDSTGNWTKATISSGNEIQYYLKRTIQYE